MHAIRVHETGGPEVLRWDEVPTPEAGPGKLLVRHTAIGVNFIDTYHRTGLYKIPLPAILGREAAGVVEAVGEGVTTFAVGDRVVGQNGNGYAEYSVAPADQTLKLPASISDDIGAAVLLKGLTARSLLRVTYKVQPGETILVHAAAGGVGQILTQWAAHIGATVIGVVGSDEKAELAKRQGCVHVIVSSREDIAKRVKEITGGKGVPVAYDSVGKDTFDATLNSLAPLGYFVSFGNASGPAPPVDPLVLSNKGALFFTRMSNFFYIRTPAQLQEAAKDLFDVLASGAVKIAPPRAYALKDAAQAHRDLEARKTTGSLILTP